MLVLSLIPFISKYFYQMNKIKLDSLICYKQLWKIVFIIYLIYFVIRNFLGFTCSLEYFIYFSVFYIGNSLLFFYICLMRYKTLKDPFSVFSSYLNIYTSNTFYQEISILIMALAFIISGYCLSNLLISNLIYAYLFSYGIVLIITILISKVIFYEIKLVKNVPSNFNKNIKKIINIEVFENLIQYTMIIVGFFFQLFIVSEKKLLTIEFIISLLYLILEEVFTMIKIYNSDYFYFILSNKRIAFFYTIFSKKILDRPSFYQESSFSLVTNDNSIQYLFDRKGLYIESYVLKLCDEIIVTLFYSLSTVYKKFNKDHSNKQESDFLENSIKNNFSYILLEKNSDKNDFNNNKIVIGNHIDSLKVSIHSFFQNKYFDLIKSRKIDVMSINNSLTSNLNSDVSIMIKNIKEDSLNNGLVINTFDKHYTIEILDDDFFKKREKVIKNHIKHIIKYKYSFLPIVFGAFSIKINEMKHINFIFYKTRFINDKPLEHFNSWQTIRINKNDEEVLESSIFKKSDNYIEKIDKDHLFNSNEKMYLLNYLQFEDNLINDFRFLKKQRIINFSLNFISFEISNLSSHQNPNYSSDDEKFRKSIKSNITFNSRNISAIK